MALRILPTVLGAAVANQLQEQQIHAINHAVDKFKKTLAQDWSYS